LKQVQPHRLLTIAVIAAYVAAAALLLPLWQSLIDWFP